MVVRVVDAVNRRQVDLNAVSAGVAVLVAVVLGLHGESKALVVVECPVQVGGDEDGSRTTQGGRHAMHRIQEPLRR